ncbi:ion transporter [candidate division KSB1 bacterium]|nr:ion transporter [candidate division KSB1 bacterium]
MRTNLKSYPQFERKDESATWRQKLHTIIFEADTPAGKLYDVILIGSILLSVLVVLVDSVQVIRESYGPWLIKLEWIFTIVFSIEYMLRLIVVRRPVMYASSFFGLIDLFAILPTYLSLIHPVTRYLTVIRILRLLRIFRVLKLVQYLKEAHDLVEALKASRRKITVFLFTVLTLVVIFGSLMYVVEGEAGGFSSIPHSIYWAIVTLTTVGYGDISPVTGLGQTLAALIMILGYSIIAVPTGIVTAQLITGMPREISTQVCPVCRAEDHDTDAKFCKLCGGKL